MDEATALTPASILPSSSYEGNLKRMFVSGFREEHGDGCQLWSVVVACAYHQLHLRCDRRLCAIRVDEGLRTSYGGSDATGTTGERVHLVMCSTYCIAYSPSVEETTWSRGSFFMNALIPQLIMTGPIMIQLRGKDYMDLFLVSNFM